VAAGGGFTSVFYSGDHVYLIRYTRLFFKTTQQQNYIGVVRALKGEQTPTDEKGSPKLFRVYSTFGAKHLVTVKRCNCHPVRPNLSRRFCDSAVAESRMPRYAQF
jgi:hypothetical protein